MICKNCQQNVSQNFCGNCGQKSSVRKVSYKYLIDEIPNSILQLNSGFLFTVKNLSLRPGHSIREFLEGKRKQYYKPVAFLLITSTLYVLSSYLFEKNTLVDEMISGMKLSMEERNETSNFDTLNWISKNQTYIILLFTPFFSLASYLSFLKSKYNYFEHLVLNIYITGQQMIIYLIFSFTFFNEDLLSTISFIVAFGYNFWTFNQFFNDKKLLNKIGLILLTYIIFIVEVLIISTVSTFIILLIKKYTT